MAHQAEQHLWQNPVRTRLAKGHPVFGLTNTTTSLDSAVEAASLGFDFLWIEMEHSPVTLETLRNLVLATRGLAAVPFARVPVNELWTAKRVLDAGVCGVIFPFTTTPLLAQRAAEACHYPPAGRRGSGAGLASRSWPEATGYHDSADANVLVVTVVEEAAALEHIDEIAATPGHRCRLHRDQRALVLTRTQRRAEPSLAGPGGYEDCGRRKEKRQAPGTPPARSGKPRLIPGARL
jgi:2-keto-3-deoxy-L-rhamnonate aldolase RhmA